MKQTFGSTQAVRQYLVDNGFPSIKRGATTGQFVANGKRARFDMCLLSKTGQSSMGSAASWGFVVVIEEAAA